MSRSINSFYCLLLTLILQSVAASTNSCAKAQNSFLEDYEETILAAANFATKNPENNSSGSNKEPDDSELEEEFIKISKEWSSIYRKLKSNNKTLNFDKKMEKNRKIVRKSYRNKFDDIYPRGWNYSEIFHDPSKKRLIDSRKNDNFTDYDFTSFPSLYKIYEYLEVLENLGNDRAMIIPLKFHKGRWHNIQTSFGNKILSIRISSMIPQKNPIIVVVAGIHGRDWYAVQSAVFLARELIINENRTSAKDFDWWIVPVLNPDGYELSRTESKWRNWRKNSYGAQFIETYECFGLDLDLNFEYQWLPCAQSLCDLNFPGNVPFQAPETRGLRDTLEAFSDYFDSFVALKEGRQMLVYPFSDTRESPRNTKSFEEISKNAVETFGQYVEGFYDHGQSSRLINISAGFIEDWAKVHLGIDKSFAFYLGPATKDRRDLKSQHLMDHMNGTFELLNVIARGKIDGNMENSSCRINLSIIYVVINFVIFQ